MESALAIVNFEEHAMSVDSVVNQIALIQEVQKKVMREGEHFGKIPGCGDKPSLLKPGAEKLGFTFRLRPEFDVVPVDWPNGHREYQVKCRLYHIPTGVPVGDGVGTCTTMEGKYRYRWDNTGREVPQEYWKNRDKDLLGGPFNTTRKVDGKWFIFQRVEHDNPADYYNTCEKMGKKRAHVDAILTATAASDIFTQDVEDMPEVIPGAKKETATASEAKPPVQTPQKKAPDQPRQARDPNEPATEPQLKAINAILGKMGIKDDFDRHEKVSRIIGIPEPEVITSLSILKKGQASKVIEALTAEGSNESRD